MCQVDLCPNRTESSPPLISRTLYNEGNNYYYYGFCVENNERIPERENLPFSISTGLSPEVINKPPDHYTGLHS
ncbi:MAG: hypothetical protein IPN96_15920 [Anaerolineales bacterium]|nr:hypothetical protein [Anaerolineales bacterium]